MTYVVSEAFTGNSDTRRLSAPELDRLLAVERKRGADAPERMIAPDSISALPDGVMIRQGDTCYAVRAGRLLPWTFSGYLAPMDISMLTSAAVYLATPPSTVAALRQGYRPAFHSQAWTPDA